MKTVFSTFAALLFSAATLCAGTSDFSIRMESSSGSSLKSTTMSSGGTVSLNGLPPGEPLRCVVTWNGVQYSINVAAGDVNGDGVAEMRAQNNNTVRSNRTEVKSPRDAASGLPTGKRMHKPYTVYCAFDASNPTQVTFHSTEQDAVQTCQRKFS
ncbi:MAG: hypothetical protein JNL32_12660, partial [Candidatus Kapabacteria bacterium]|nr:hypothetical protein [Candidatus Kapabacteria bacterium]